MLEPMSFSSLSSRRANFDVFMSFRGADTRRHFASFLYKELDRKGIRTFKDDQQLERGRQISPELVQAIKESKFAVVVISENYASSAWCLEELAKIMHFEEKGSLTVIPIFYEIEPSNVRRQTGKFAKHFRKHKKRVNRKKVQRWRNALTKLANIRGECSRKWEDDSKLVDEITDKISSRLFPTTPRNFRNLVGMDLHMKAMYKLLDLESNKEVRVVGVWGMGSVGRTTLARSVYEEISQHFQTYCFLENVKRISRYHGPPRLREEFLSKIQVGSLTNSSYVGSNVVKARLGNQKVLLVADDLDQIEQLDALAEVFNWFGEGSRVVITTQDKHLLVSGGVKHVYEVESLRYCEARQLCRQFAFNQRHPSTGFASPSYRAVNIPGALLLAVKLFNSFLCGGDRASGECKTWSRSIDPQSKAY